MKKFLVLLMCLCLFSALLAGCTSTSEESSVVESSVESSTAESSVESVVEGSEESTSETETTETASEEDTSSEESTVVELYDWDCNKGWPVYVGEYVETYDEVATPYGRSKLWCTAKVFKALEIDLLFPVYFIPEKTEYADGTYLFTDEGEYVECRSFLTGLGIPFELTETISVADAYHANLSFDDVAHLSELAEQQGIAIEVGICDCGRWDENNTAAPEIPENWLELIQYLRKNG